MISGASTQTHAYDANNILTAATPLQWLGRIVTTVQNTVCEHDSEVRHLDKSEIKHFEKSTIVHKTNPEVARQVAERGKPECVSEQQYADWLLDRLSEKDTKLKTFHSLGQGNSGRVSSEFTYPGGPLSVRKELIDQSDQIKRALLYFEGLCLSKFDHTNIVRGKLPDSACVPGKQEAIEVKMEYRGVSLKDLTSTIINTENRRKQPDLLPVTLIKSLMYQLLQGLNYLYEIKSGYSDIKLENMTINPNTGILSFVDLCYLANASPICSGRLDKDYMAYVGFTFYSLLTG